MFREKILNWRRYRHSFESHCPFGQLGRTGHCRKPRSSASCFAAPWDREALGLVREDHQEGPAVGSAAEMLADSWAQRQSSGAGQAFPWKDRLGEAVLVGKAFPLDQSCSAIDPRKGELASCQLGSLASD